MNLGLVGRAIAMAAVTYPSRALPLLVPGIDRLPDRALAYLRLVGPAVLAALAAVNVLVVTDADGQSALRFGIEPWGVLVGVVVVAWRRNLFLGILAAVALTAVARAIGLAALP
ncbi:MAG: AzlD domain-containing protein [Candidatus Limnocylindrales bacterium]